MRTNIQNLAVDYALEQCPSYTKQVRDNTITDEYREIYDNCKKDFEEGFKKCLELVKPILAGTLSVLDQIKNEDFIANKDIKQFLEEYK